MLRNLFAAAVTAAALGFAGAAAAQTTPYFVMDGDSSTGWRIQGGTATSFAVPVRSYPLAVRTTVLVHDRDDNGSTEYSLAAVPTGVTIAGPNVVGGQQLDGAATASSNFTVIYNTRQVIRSNPDFSAPTVAFTLPGGDEPTGITADSNGDLLVIVGFGSNVVRRYSQAGALLGSFTTAMTDMCCLAYEASTDSLWAVNRGSNAIFQLNKTTGATISTFVPAGFAASNPFGGEMAAAAAPPPATVPTLSEWAMILLAGMLVLGGLWTVNRRRLTA